MSAPRVIGLGEALVRLSTPGHERLEQAAALEVDVGGAELNVLGGVAALGLDAVWLTRLADNPLGRRIAAHAAALGVRAEVDWDAFARAPLYFAEHGIAPRPSEVLYDRGASAMTTLDPGTFDWHRQVGRAGAALATGITCALGDGPAEAVGAFLAAARSAGARTVFDVNHRSRLWGWDEAVPVLRPLLDRVDVLLAGGHDLVRLLGRDEDDREDGVRLAREAIEAFGHDVVVLRDTSATAPARVAVRVTAVTATEEHTSATHEAAVVDAFGAGDAALAALLAGLLRGSDLPAAIDAAAWACAFHHTVPGDSWRIRAGDLARRADRVPRILR
jgi:2-dehydro-3-deoxygluconokinase